MSATPSNVTYLYQEYPGLSEAPRIRRFARTIPTLAHILRLAGVPVIRLDLNLSVDVTITRR